MDYEKSVLFEKDPQKYAILHGKFIPGDYFPEGGIEFMYFWDRQEKTFSLVGARVQIGEYLEIDDWFASWQNAEGENLTQEVGVFGKYQIAGQMTDDEFLFNLFFPHEHQTRDAKTGVISRFAQSKLSFFEIKRVEG